MDKKIFLLVESFSLFFNIGNYPEFKRDSIFKEELLMAYSHRVVSGIDVVNIEDSMDLYSVPELKKFCRSLARNETSKILLVLKKVHFMDSSGLGMLTNLFFECQQKGIPLKFADLSNEAKRMFALTKLEKSFRLYDTEDEAIRDFY